MEYHYIAFFNVQTHSGDISYGYIDITRQSPIASGEDINGIELDIKKLKPQINLVTITNIQRLPI